MLIVRTYRQFCPAAKALDAIGERWSLLIVRDLLHGPKRYTELQEGLPGIGPSVLGARLRELQEAGVVDRRRLPPPAASVVVYELSESGEALRPVLAALFHWGLRFASRPGKNEARKASWWLPAIEASLEPESLEPGVAETYELRIGGEAISVRVEQGKAEVRETEAERPAVVVSTDQETFAALGRGAISPSEALTTDALSVEGDPAAAERCAQLFGLDG